MSSVCPDCKAPLQWRRNDHFLKMHVYECGRVYRKGLQDVDPYVMLCGRQYGDINTDPEEYWSVQNDSYYQTKPRDHADPVVEQEQAVCLWPYLQVALTSDEITLQKAYHLQAKKFHPDKPSGSTEKFKALQNEYELAMRLLEEKYLR